MGLILNTTRSFFVYMEMNVAFRQKSIDVIAIQLTNCNCISDLMQLLLEILEERLHDIENSCM